MFTVELYAGVRRAVMVDGLSRREAAKRFGVHRKTISKMKDIARMEKSETLTRHIDFAKIRRLLAARPTAEDHNSGWEQETQLALGGYLIARYIEWARRDNR